VHGHIHTDMSSFYRSCASGLSFSVSVYFSLGQFICVRVSYFVFYVFPLCCCLVVSTDAIDCLERLVSEITCYVLSGTLNPKHSLTHSLKQTRYDSIVSTLFDGIRVQVEAYRCSEFVCIHS